MVTPSPLPAEGQTTLADFTTDGDEPSQDPTLEDTTLEQGYWRVADAEGGVIADNHGNRGYARGGIPNSCSRCGQVHRRARAITEGYRCLTCEDWGEDSDALDGHRFTTRYFHHPLWATQYARLQDGA